jgi:hypothetical protein
MPEEDALPLPKYPFLTTAPGERKEVEVPIEDVKKHISTLHPNRDIEETLQELVERGQYTLSEDGTKIIASENQGQIEQSVRVSDFADQLLYIAYSYALSIQEDFAERYLERYPNLSAPRMQNVLAAFLSALCEISGQVVDATIHTAREEGRTEDLEHLQRLLSAVRVRSEAIQSAQETSDLP